MVRQKLVGDERIVRPTPDHVGKGTAAINPKFPSTVCCHDVCLNGLSIRHFRPYTEKNWRGPAGVSPRPLQSISPPISPVLLGEGSAPPGPGGVSRQAPSMHQPAYKPGSVGRGLSTPARRPFLCDVDCPTP